MGKREKEETKRVRMKQSPGTTNIFKKDGMRLLLLALPFVMISLLFSMYRYLAGCMLLLTINREFLYRSHPLWG